MKKRHSFLVAAALGLGLASFGGASCSQPPIQCVVGHGSFIAKYSLVEGTGSCADLVGEEIGLATFLAPNDDRTLADYDKRSIAVQSDTFGGLIREREGLGAGEEDVPYAFGAYTTNPDERDLCYAGGASGTAALAPAELDLPEAETMDAMGNPVTLPAKRLRQSWENLSIYVTAAAPGTQVVGTMKYEDLMEGCSATYTFVALFPAVQCAKSDADGNPTNEPDDALCDPTGNAAEGRTPSGINPDYRVKCDPTLLYCVLDETPRAAP
ncbi:hypothetical protein [Polyangium jinanense]|uniref:MlpA protein n=1 Tax=Polyangium jinanense TaxID=2829994 RepID=A0A9X3X3N3_9BACT|nr:hypothetical protein [Polyangium jinanense]MDC3958152.1 hypothetical protein [Polyangium jinanense]MDC3983649.1 hypothetical protein [Polyangium jinanense]